MNEAKNKTDAELVSILKELKTAELDIVARSLAYLNEVFDRKLDLQMGYPSIYEFALKELGYDTDQAYPRIRAAEPFRTDPKMENHLREGRISMTSLMIAQIAFRAESSRLTKLGEPKLTQENRIVVLNEILDCSTREVRKILANRFPHLDKHNEKESVKPLSGDRVMLQIIVTQEEFDDIQRLRGLLAHQNFDGKYGPVLAKATQITLEKLAPKAKPKKAKPKQEEPVEEQLEFIPNPKPFGAKRKRQYLSLKTRRDLHEKAGYQCQYMSPEGHRCQCTYALEPDQIIPIARGGTNEISNLRILCDAHNRFVAWRDGLPRENLKEEHRH